MFRTQLLPMSLLLACVFLVTAAVAAPISSDPSVNNSRSAIRTHLQPDLTFKSSLSLELFPVVAVHQKTCRCSCGYPCNQNDDCGPGGICEQFISCCDREETNRWLQQTAQRSTHTGEEAPAMSMKCK
jgi:hypothetical protein